MKKKTTIVLVAILLLMFTTLALASKKAKSKCYWNGELVCEGECCKITSSGCEAGPCDIILR